MESYPWRVCSRESEIVYEVSISAATFYPPSRSNLGVLVYRAYLVGKKEVRGKEKGTDLKNAYGMNVLSRPLIFAICSHKGDAR